MKNRTILIIVVLVITLIIGWTIYQVCNNKETSALVPENESVERGHRQNNYKLAKYIGFDDNQQQQFQELEDVYRQELTQLKEYNS